MRHNKPNGLIPDVPHKPTIAEIYGHGQRTRASTLVFHSIQPLVTDTEPTQKKRRAVFEECSREESKHQIFGASKTSPQAVYVFTGRHVSEWPSDHCREEDFQQNGYFFVRRVED